MEKYHKTNCRMGMRLHLSTHSWIQELAIQNDAFSAVLQRMLWPYDLEDILV